jgi:hypothetical protein
MWNVSGVVTRLYIKAVCAAKCVLPGGMGQHPRQPLVTEAHTPSSDGALRRAGKKRKCPEQASTLVAVAGWWVTNRLCRSRSGLQFMYRICTCWLRVQCFLGGDGRGVAEWQQGGACPPCSTTTARHGTGEVRMFGSQLAANILLALFAPVGR